MKRTTNQSWKVSAIAAAVGLITVGIGGVAGAVPTSSLSGNVCVPFNGGSGAGLSKGFVGVVNSNPSGQTVTCPIERNNATSTGNATIFASFHRSATDTVRVINCYAVSVDWFGNIINAAQGSESQVGLSLLSLGVSTSNGNNFASLSLVCSLPNSGDTLNNILTEEF
jgi:hypothetical protein